RLYPCLLRGDYICLVGSNVFVGYTCLVDLLFLYTCLADLLIYLIAFNDGCAFNFHPCFAYLMHYIMFLGQDFSDTTIFHRPQFFSDYNFSMVPLMHYIMFLGQDFSDTTIFHRPQFFSDYNFSSTIFFSFNNFSLILFIQIC
ncbi:hypothetical protein ACJX0J_040594, partial [Zea mays]